MAFLIKFKDDFTKNKWVNQINLHSTIAGANRVAKYLRKNKTDEKGKDIHLVVKIAKVDARKPPYNKMPIYK